ncbi:FAD/NAD(P)-binding oxidoreductase [Frankia sp. Cppng1_Ct_nod]|uniref:NAD(P)/FAD-dependent oxidoreductase n=1 Tax=Frankia sp. Cppng1_Ct_nod TaxID=2897162 RepID=UPI0020249994|nr:FAD/NAD(P)-binding oxidoreductase [Frankia sp. Cppng1_Ct_nod]
MERIVVVGAGLAGGRVCQELRAAGYTEALTLVGSENHLPYDRPPLSKAVLAGRTDDTTLPLDLGGVELLLGRRASGLRPGVVETDGGPLDFDGLVIATGADPVRLPGDGPQRVLRTIDDARALRDVLRPGLRLAVVGAGWIGAEVATSAAAAGAQVTVVEAAATPLAQALGEDVGSHLIDWYARAGVTLRLGTSVDAVRPDGLDLAGGDHVVADEVVVGVGVRPSTGWLAGSGLEIDRGVVVDEHLAATWPVPVVCVGDSAAWWSRRYATRLRVEHWDCAQQSPAVAAAALLGADAVYDPVPYFWSEQFGRMVQFAGLRPAGATPVWRGDPTQPKGWSAGWFDGDDRLAAVLAVGRPADVVRGRRLMAAGGTVDPDRFADLATPLA